MLSSHDKSHQKVFSIMSSAMSARIS